MALVASLVVMVMISGYENFVSRFDESNNVHWLGEIDVGSLKIKVAATIVAISSIVRKAAGLRFEGHDYDATAISTTVKLGRPHNGAARQVLYRNAKLGLPVAAGSFSTPSSE